MADLVEPWIMRQAKVDGRNAWHYLFQSTIGDLHIVQHEVQGEMNIVDDYMGWSNDKADKKFEQLVARMIRGKD